MAGMRGNEAEGVENIDGRFLITAPEFGEPMLEAGVRMPEL